jgi:tetratricopeptide (TPR) repeat protein
MRRFVTARFTLAILLAVLAVGGCRTTPVPVERVRGPAETVEYYLGNFYRSQMTRDLYTLLAPASRKELTYQEFTLQRLREIDIPNLAFEQNVPRVEAAVLDAYQVNARHHIYYALQQVRYPYAGASHNLYRLIRLHAVNVRDEWYIEPFVDERTYTIRLLPALKRDALRNLYDQREEIERIVEDDIVAMRLGDSAPATDLATDTDPLDIPDLAGGTDELPEISDDEVEDGEGEAVSDALASRIEVGNLYLRSGRLELAERAFGQALEMDPANAEAADGLERVQKVRELRKIRQDIAELLERILEAEGARAPEDGAAPE